MRDAAPAYRAQRPRNPLHWRMDAALCGSRAPFSPAQRPGRNRAQSVILRGGDAASFCRMRAVVCFFLLAPKP
eukprot:3392923-Pleurochrysis_carterae.AAC.1